MPWWERYRDRYQLELEMLDAAGIAWERDEEAFQKGFLRLNLKVPHDGEQLPLQVTFPDLFPYFRFEVDAPTLDLSHHQNPFHKNLCLMGRATFHWHTNDTVAGVLRQQLSTTIATGKSSDVAATRGLEVEQAEPFSDYYPYPPSMVVIPGEIVIPEDQHRGTFTLQTIGPQGPPASQQFARGALTSLRTTGGVELLQPSALTSAYQGKLLEGIWVKFDAPIPLINQGLFLQELLRRVPEAHGAPINRVDGGYQQIWGVAFPEENSRRNPDGLGWVFVCLFGKSRSDMARIETGRPVASSKPRRSNGKSKKGRGKKKGRRR